MKETGTDTFNEGESKGSEKPLDKGKAPSYYAASPFPSHSMYPASPTPSMLPLPVIPLPEQCSPFQISPFKLPQSQVCPQAHQVSPKMAQLSPGSSAYSNCIYSSNPASPMQVVYSPGQCHTDNQCHGGTSLPLHHIPLHQTTDMKHTSTGVILWKSQVNTCSTTPCLIRSNFHMINLCGG